MDSVLDSAFDEMDEDLLELDPTLENIVKSTKLKWIFVGGKGGVGKTTCSCSLALRLAEVRESVLILSTDPAHNVSDAFGQKFTGKPTKVEGTSNLWAMEIDPPGVQGDMSELTDQLPGGMGSIMQDLAFKLPGIDEALSFSEVMKQVRSMQFSCIVFDTAPTGHTLRFLQFPSTLSETFNKLMEMKNKFGGLVNQMTQLMGGNMPNLDEMKAKLEENNKLIEEVSLQFRNPELTTFIPVMIPEFLSLFETERLIQELGKFGIDVNSLIVNQIVYPEVDSSCALCLSRQKMQSKYLDQVAALYDAYHVVRLPLQTEEIRGLPTLTRFSQYLLSPFVPPQ